MSRTWPEIQVAHYPYYRDGNAVPSGNYFVTGLGWRDIVVDCANELAEIFPDFDIQQIKEKFGGLRFYCSVDGDPRADEIIRRAEERAAVSCETCGNAAVLDDNQYWVKTLCPWHIGERARAHATAKLKDRIERLTLETAP